MKIWNFCRYLHLLLFLAAVWIFVSGCGNGNRRKLKLVTEPPYPPFEYYVNEKLTGIDIDIMKEIARRLDCDLEIQPISFDMVLKSVESGQADVAMSSITITEERSRTVDFTVPYMHVGQMVVVPAKSPIRRLEHLRGKIIGAQEGTTGEKYVREKYGKVVSLPNVDVATESLSSGKIDALVLDNIPAEDIVAKNAFFRMFPEKLTEESLGIAVSKKGAGTSEEDQRDSCRYAQNGADCSDYETACPASGTAAGGGSACQPVANRNCAILSALRIEEGRCACGN